MWENWVRSLGWEDPPEKGAVVGRHRVDAQVEVLAVDGDLDSAVLRDALLGDLHLRHDLDSRDDRALAGTGSTKGPKRNKPKETHTDIS